MATIFNKRKHSLEAGGVTLAPGENTVDDALWANANVPGSQFEAWNKLNWIAVKRSLPVAGAAKSGSGPTVFHAPSVDGPVSQEPGSDMNPGSNPNPQPASSPSASPAEPDKSETDESKRGLRTRR